MPELKPTKLFLKDIGVFESNRALYNKIVKTLGFLQSNPFHPGLQIERIVNDPTAWSARVDSRYRISLDPLGYNNSGAPNWEQGIVLLQLLDHDDLYKKPR